MLDTQRQARADEPSVVDRVFIACASMRREIVMGPKAALLLSFVAFLPLATAPRAGHADAFDALQHKDFESAVKTGRADLERASVSGDGGERVRALRQLVLAQLSAEESDFARAALDRIDGEPNRDAWTQSDWYAGIELEAVRLVRADSGAIAGSIAFRNFERLAWTGGDDATRAGSTLCGIAIGLSAIGWEDPARRIYAAAAARFSKGESLSTFRAACVLDRVAYSTGTWGLVTADQDRADALSTILRQCPDGLAPAAAEFTAGQAHKDQLLLALPEETRVAQVSARMDALREARENLFVDVGNGIVFPRGFMALVPGCRTADSTGIGVVLLPRSKGSEQAGVEVEPNAAAESRAQRMGDALVRVELARRGVLVSGTTLKHSGTRTAKLLELARRAPQLRRFLPAQIRELLEYMDMATQRLGDVQRLHVSRPVGPDSLMSSPAFHTLFEFGGKSILSLADKALAGEIYVNPRIPYMDWGAREMDYGCGFVFEGHGAERAWSASEYWRAANLKKYVALNSIARNSVGMPAEERSLIRRQMTTYWECVVADARVHVAERALESMVADSVTRGLDEVHAREARALNRLEEVRKISDTPQLRRFRKTFLASDLARANAAKEEDLSHVLPSGTLLITLSTTRSSTTVVAALMGDGPDAKPQWYGYRLPFGRAVLADKARRLRDLLETWAPESEVLEAGGALFDDLLGRNPILEWLATCKRIVIAPNGPAGDIPFNALAWQSAGRREFVSLSKPISVTESVALLRLQQEAREDSSNGRYSVFIVASPKSRPVMEPITETRVTPPDSLKSSSKDLATLYAIGLVEGSRATEGCVRAALQDSSLVHVATHGFVPPDTLTHAPLSAGFWTTPDSAAGDPSGDGVLQAWEVVTQMSSRADLVVLSACETGALWTQMGTIGELARSLLYSGAKTVVVSQWRIPDRETHDLMLAFHKSLKAGKAKDEALMLAMQSFHSRTNAGVPGFWAGFRCVGLGW